MRHIYQHSCLMSGHKLICICCLYVSFVVHGCWHIYGNSLVRVAVCCIFFYLLCSNGVLHVDCSSSAVDKHMQCGRYMYSGAYVNNVKFMYTMYILFVTMLDLHVCVLWLHYCLQWVHMRCIYIYIYIYIYILTTDKVVFYLHMK